MKMAYEKITQPMVIKKLIIISIILMIFGLLFAYIVAYIFGGTRSEPFSYNIIDNYISDLGSINYTPIPLTFDLIAIATSLCLLPIFMYSYNLAILDVEKENNRKNKFIYTFSKLMCRVGQIAQIIGSIGFFGVGLFSEDRNFGDIHYLFAALCFIGLAVGSCVYGLMVLLNDAFLPNIMGILMLFFPISSIIVFGFNLIISPPFIAPALLEWIMLFSIMWWMIPAGFIEIKLINNMDSESKNK